MCATTSRSCNAVRTPSPVVPTSGHANWQDGYSRRLQYASPHLESFVREAGSKDVELYSNPIGLGRAA